MGTSTTTNQCRSSTYGHSHTKSSWATFPPSVHRSDSIRTHNTSPWPYFAVWAKENSPSTAQVCYGLLDNVAAPLPHRARDQTRGGWHPSLLPDWNLPGSPAAPRYRSKGSFPWHHESDALETALVQPRVSVLLIPLSGFKNKTTAQCFSIISPLPPRQKELYCIISKRSTEKEYIFNLTRAFLGPIPKMLSIRTA